MRLALFSFCCSLFLFTSAQSKKPLDHTVYDSWEAINERLISNDGRWVAYTVNPQEGDGRLVVSDAAGGHQRSIPRGYNATLTEDSRYCIFKIKPLYQQTRTARIQKKRPDEMPKDSLGILDLTADTMVKIARVRTYETPEKAGDWLAYRLEKSAGDTSGRRRGSKSGTSLADARQSDPQLDSAIRVIDSLRGVLGRFPEKVIQKYLVESEQGKKDEYVTDADEPSGMAAGADEGTDLVLKSLQTGGQRIYRLVSDYGFSDNGKKLWLKTTKRGTDSLSKAYVLLIDLKNWKADTIMRGLNDAKNFAMDEKGEQLAFVAERDSAVKALRKIYKLWYYKPGMDSATMLVGLDTNMLTKGWAISENATLSFSKTGKRLLLGTAPYTPLKDTLTPDFEKVSVDIWNYKDDYLQTIQLKGLDRSLKRSYDAVYNFDNKKLLQLGTKEMERVESSKEGDGELFLGVDNREYRVASQWLGSTRSDVYAINPETGKTTPVVKGLSGNVSVSTGGKYIIWYDDLKKNYFTWHNGKIHNITARIKVPLYDEENDVPSDPNPYGIAAWYDGDDAVLIRDRYDLWKVDPDSSKAPVCLTNSLGRTHKIRFDYQPTEKQPLFTRGGRNNDEPIKKGEKILITAFHTVNKTAGMILYDQDKAFALPQDKQPTSTLR